eukprot:COSAG05_NODE_1599_length_4452_cov_2.249024_2_plen_259_part_00
MVERMLTSRIQAQGPVSIGDFMQEVLSAPVGGYYTEAAATDDGGSKLPGHGGVFGARGDFVTAPEISQLFGELVGLWSIAVWQAAGQPSRCEIVELGPGGGKMMSDILRTAKHFKSFGDALEVVLVEASPPLRRAQAAALGVAELHEVSDDGVLRWTPPGSSHQVEREDGCMAIGMTDAGVLVRWYQHFTTAVPATTDTTLAGADRKQRGLKGAATTADGSAQGLGEGGEGREPLLLVLANEFFDALPARQFVQTARG